MFKIVTSLTLALVGLLAKAQNETRTEPFHALNVNNKATVVFTPGPEYRVSYQADPETAAGLMVRVDSGTLYVSQKDGVPVQVLVTAPFVDDIVATQHAVFVATMPIETADFSLGLASGARFNGTVNASHAAQLRGKSNAIFNILLYTKKLDANFTGGTKANLSGTAQMGNIVTHGNTLCLARNFRMENAKIGATGYSEVQVCVQGAIDVDAADQATVRYFGTPKRLTIDPEAIATITE